MTAPVRTERHGSVALVVLDRPAALNALDHGLRDGLVAALAAADQDERVRALVITGAGERAFSVGLDMKVSLSLHAGNVEVWLRGLQRYFQAVRALDKPCVAGLNGVAMGLGLQTALHCDVRIGHPGVRASQPEIRAGVPSVLGHMVLSEIVGSSRAVELSLRSRELHAEECLRLGLLHEIVPAAEVVPRSLAVAEQMGGLPATAVRLSKAHARAESQAAFDLAIEAAIALQREAYASGEPHAYAEAFLARRGPAPER